MNMIFDNQHHKKYHVEEFDAGITGLQLESIHFTKTGDVF